MLLRRLILLVFSAALCTGYVTTTVRPTYTPYNNDVLDNNSSAHSYETLCARTHSNAAFVGVQPYSKLLLNSPAECFKTCFQGYPNCVAVVYYNLHSGNLNNVCYTFDRNSVDKNVALVPEKPANPQDVIRSLEISNNCHAFDPCPPPADSYVQSSDRVSESERVEKVSTVTSVHGDGHWSQWTNCNPRSPMQIRSQACEYGHLVNRRRCSYGSMFPGYRAAIIINANIPYPPMPYLHPDCYTQEYETIMSQHLNQMRQICCVKQKQAEEVTATETFVPTCRRICYDDQTNFDIDDKSEYGEEEHNIQDVLAPSVWQPWSEWSVCLATCGVGSMQRHRICSGENCQGGDSFEVKSCDNLEPCETWSQWQEWGLCSGSCGEGTKTRYRYCHLGAHQCDGPDYEVRDCNTGRPCPGWGEWGPWSGCSATCGTGATKSRSRSCMYGTCDGPMEDIVVCELEPCTAWSEWQEWAVTVTCGFGQKTRSRVCVGGRNCEGGLPDETENYDSGINCPEWLEWAPWSACEGSCTYGSKSRSRECQPSIGSLCKGEKEQVEQCMMRPLEQWGPWSEWSQCSESCGDGNKERRRVCWGTSCPGQDNQVETCNEAFCSIWQPWGEWVSAAPCGPTSKKRTRECMKDTRFLGSYAPECIGESTQIDLDLQAMPCPEETQWSPWSGCSVTCGIGIETRTKGYAGYEDKDTRSCNTNVPCVHWSHWEAWSNCDSECGVGQRFRSRKCIDSNGYETHGCIGLEKESSVCNDRPCCSWTEWTKFSACDRVCGGGKMKRMRTCDRPGHYSGAHCNCIGPNEEQLPCNNGPCPTPSQSTIKKYGGKRKFKTKIETVPGGCENEPCPPAPPSNVTDCHWENWCAWSPCPVSCNYGATRRHRFCVGNNNCRCDGPSLQKVNCVASEQCRKKRK